MEGTPYYDSEKKAIFVHSLSLLDSTVDAAGYKGNLAPLSKEVMQLINGYLVSNPVYKLDTTNKLLAAQEGERKAILNATLKNNMGDNLVY